MLTCDLRCLHYLQEILDKYPPWLDKHLAPGSPLSPDDLERYRHQYMCIRRLCEAYETEPNNTAKIMELLQEVREAAEQSSRTQLAS